MTLNDKVYSILKWCCLLAIPACATLYSGLATIWGWPYADAISQTANVVGTFLGAIIGVSSYNYNKTTEVK